MLCKKIEPPIKTLLNSKYIFFYLCICFVFLTEEWLIESVLACYLSLT